MAAMGGGRCATRFYPRLAVATGTTGMASTTKTSSLASDRCAGCYSKTTATAAIAALAVALELIDTENNAHVYLSTISVWYALGSRISIYS
jgi:hypothetical protein